MDWAATLEREARGLSGAASRRWPAAIERYPGWTALDLLTHTGGVHRWVADLVRTRVTGPAPRPSYRGRVAPDEAVPWFAAGVADLLDVLSGVDPSTAVWSFSGDQTAGFWRRRMAHETAIHRWDAEQAMGDPAPFDPALAAGGVEEALDIYVARRLRGLAVGGGGETALLACTDRPEAWRIALLPGGVDVEPADGDAPATATLVGPASALWLFVMGRAPLSALEVTGNRVATVRLEHALSLLADATP